MESKTILLLIGFIAFAIIMTAIEEWLRVASRRVNERKFLKTKKWAEIKAKAFQIHGRSCAVCGTSEHLDVHHLRYRKGIRPIFGREDPKNDLRILCRRHHPKGRYTRFDIAMRRLIYKVFKF